MQMLQAAEALAKAELYMPPELRGKPADILALMFRARGMDIPLAVAWDELYATADGDVARRAKLVRALARRAGHRIDFVERDRFHAVAVVTTRDGDRHEVSFTLQEATERGYLDPSYEYVDAWTRMPEDMLVARVTTRAVNWFCPEVLLGMGSELPEHADDAQNASQVVEIREERRAQVNQVLRLVALSEKQPNGQVRLNLLRGLFMECRDAMLLDYDATGTGETSVRHVLTDAMRSADGLAREQSSGQAPTADPADGPQTLDDLRGLDAEAVAAEDDPDGEARRERAAADKEAEEAAYAEARAQAPAPEPEPVKKPRKRAAKKAAPKKATAKKTTGKASGRAQGGTAGASGAVAEGTARTDGSATQGSPAARSADRPAARPDDARLPCGCLVDEIISTGQHAAACTGRQGGTR